MKNKQLTIIYDGSFNGFLSAVFLAFEQKLEVVDIKRSQFSQGQLFSETIKVTTDENSARRVWYAVQKGHLSAIKTIYFAFLSEFTGIEFMLYSYIRRLMINSSNSTTYCPDDVVMKINQLASLVGREKKRLESELEMQTIYSDLKLAYVEPDFNVLPLLSKFIRSCHKDSDWVLFDLKRKYGIYCHANKLQLVSASFISNNLSQRYLVEGDREIISIDDALEHFQKDTHQDYSFRKEKNPTAA